jgi:hypothetical protein
VCAGSDKGIKIMSGSLKGERLSADLTIDRKLMIKWNLEKYEINSSNV